MYGKHLYSEQIYTDTLYYENDTQSSGIFLKWNIFIVFMRILETRFNTDCGQYRFIFDAQTSLYAMVQIRDRGLWRDFKVRVLFEKASRR